MRDFKLRKRFNAFVDGVSAVVIDMGSEGLTPQKLDYTYNQVKNALSKGFMLVCKYTEIHDTSTVYEFGVANKIRFAEANGQYAVSFEENGDEYFYYARNPNDYLVGRL